MSFFSYFFNFSVYFFFEFPLIFFPLAKKKENENLNSLHCCKPSSIHICIHLKSHYIIIVINSFIQLFILLEFIYTHIHLFSSEIA